MFVPVWIPKHPKSITNQNRIWSEKRDFLKNSTSPKQDTHFGRSRVPKPLPTSAKHIVETNQKSNRHFESWMNLHWFWLHCATLLVPIFAKQIVLKSGAAESHQRPLEVTWRRTCPEKWNPKPTPRAPYGRPRVPQERQNGSLCYRLDQVFHQVGRIWSDWDICTTFWKLSSRSTDLEGFQALFLCLLFSVCIFFCIFKWDQNKQWRRRWLTCGLSGWTLGEIDRLNWNLNS